jgi:hypothetical protein
VIAKNQHALLRKGWTVKRLWILSIVGLSGLALDAAFHTIDSGTPLTIVLDGAEFKNGIMYTNAPPYVLALSWTGHITFLSAFAMLVVLPKLFFKGEVTKGQNRWAIFKEGKNITKLWMISLIGFSGIMLDLAFHWIQDGGPEQIVINGADNPYPVNVLALAAHALFIAAFVMLMFLPKILFKGKSTYERQQLA